MSEASSLPASSRTDDGSIDHELTQLAVESSEDEDPSDSAADDETRDSLVDLEHFKKMHNPVAATILEKSQSEHEYRLTTRNRYTVIDEKTNKQSLHVQSGMLGPYPKVIIDNPSGKQSAGPSTERNGSKEVDEGQYSGNLSCKYTGILKTYLNTSCKFLKDYVIIILYILILY